MSNLRVIQWTTGKVGKLALRGILDDPRLDLVGVYAWGEDKRGADAGALCGRPDCGVAATNDVDALVALGADVVIYTPFMADVDHVVQLLESGANVISSNLFLNVGGIEGEVAERLEAACQRGGSSLYVSGVNPGWINAMAVALTAVCRDVQSVEISETADVSVYESKETWEMMGMAKSEASPEVMAIAQGAMVSFRDAVRRMAEGLGWDLDEVEFSAEYATASRDVDLGFMTIPKDTHGAIRCGWHGRVEGRTVVHMEAIWFLTTELNEGWQRPDEHYHVVVKGEPTVDTHIQFIPPESWGNHEWDTMTAMPAVNAAFDVKAARPGVLTLRDMGLPAAPAGAWSR